MSQESCAPTRMPTLDNSRGSIEKRFMSMQASPQQQATMKELRERFTQLALFVHANCPLSQYTSRALRMLEDSCMQTIKAVTHHE